MVYPVLGQNPMEHLVPAKEQYQLADRLAEYQAALTGDNADDDD